jgi:hypothetical protein
LDEDISPKYKAVGGKPGKKEKNICLRDYMI